MSVEFFLAKRLYFSRINKRYISTPALRVAMLGVAIGVFAMIMSVSIVLGFQHQIRAKLAGFVSHITISSSQEVVGFDSPAITFSHNEMNKLKSDIGVKNVQGYVTASAIIKTENDFQGIVLKGIDSLYDSSFIRSHLVKGSMPSSLGKTDILLSEYIAQKLNLQVGDSFLVYFVADNIKVRKLTVKGIYNFHLEEYDRLFALVDSHLLQRVKGWSSNMWSGIEITCPAFSDIPSTSMRLLNMESEALREGSTQEGFQIQTIFDIYPNIFSWLKLLDTNTVVIITLMLIVAGVSMISGLLILIIEQSNLIGLLKAMGTRNRSIRLIFLYFGSFIILKGMFWGNLIGLFACFAQSRWNIIRLDSSIYYLPAVPIELSWTTWILLNLATLVIAVGMMVFPSYAISRISPAKAMRFE